MVAKQGRDIYHKKNTDVVVAKNEDLVEKIKKKKFKIASKTGKDLKISVIGVI